LKDLLHQLRERVTGHTAASLDVSKKVVLAAFLGVAEHFVGFTNLFEAFFGFPVTGVFVGAVLYILASVSPLVGFVDGGPSLAADRVVVFFLSDPFSDRGGWSFDLYR